MALTATNRVLAEVFGASEGAALRAKQAALVVSGIAALAVSAKIMVPMLPVPMSMGTFAVLTIGAAYGARLGLVTIIGYMLVGMLGFDVFATLALGLLAARGWDRSPVKMAGAMLIGNALIYVPGLLWLGVLYGFDKPILAWGLTPFLMGDAVKLALAAVLLPALWKLVGRARG